MAFSDDGRCVSNTKSTIVELSNAVARTTEELDELVRSKFGMVSEAKKQVTPCSPNPLNQIEENLSETLSMLRGVISMCSDQLSRLR